MNLGVSDGSPSSAGTNHAIFNRFDLAEKTALSREAQSRAGRRSTFLDASDTVPGVRSHGEAHVDAGRPDQLPLTGERTIPGIAEENYWFLGRPALSSSTSSQVAAERCGRSFVGSG